MKIQFNLESNPSVGFYALYASLRFFKEFKVKSHTEPNSVNTASAECYCMLEDLKEQYPKEYAEARDEYNSVYKSFYLNTLPPPINSIPVDFELVTGKSPVVEVLKDLTDKHIDKQTSLLKNGKNLLK
tara:strand:+ start:17010 stop:17393 length:384 start_codon:yes stop_codon:yes gene_type:complete